MRIRLVFLSFAFFVSLHSARGLAQQAGDIEADVSKNSEQNQEPKTEVFHLGEVVVSDQRIANIEEATTTTTVTDAEIKARGDKSLTDTLQHVPGITTYRHGKGHMRLRMRGFDMPYVALLVDGIPIADVYEANVDISRLSVMNASEIIINRGTSSALYGTTGTVGSINIVTQKPLELYAGASAEYGIGNDYNFNAAHGNAIGDFYYFVTATVDREAPYHVSNKLTRSERRAWFDRFFIDNLGYTVDDASTAAKTYLNDTGKWPHTEMNTYQVTAKAGYTFYNDFDAGINASYAYSEAERYSLSLANIEEYKPATGAWDDTATFNLNSSAFNWRHIHSVNAAPYLSYKKGDVSVKVNVFTLYTYEYLDGYQDADETIPVRGWGGDHSNWQNTSVGFNLFPSYQIVPWNRLNASILFRWDGHLEKEKADSDFVGTGLGSADAAKTLTGYDWFSTKRMAGEQLTLALEDEIDLHGAIDVPVDISVGISWDAQNLDDYKARSATREKGRVTAWGRSYKKQYIAEDDAILWGTRDSFNPVIGVTYEPILDFLLLRGSYSQKTKLPTMSQYASVLENTDNGLKPEKSHHTNAGFELFFMKKNISLRADYFYSMFRDKLVMFYDRDNPSTKYYTNINGQEHQGVELISDFSFDRIASTVDLDLDLSYTYLRMRNLDTDVKDSTLNKGSRIADMPSIQSIVPQHQLIGGVKADFVTGTSLNAYGAYTANARRYVMARNPEPNDRFSTGAFRTVRLHNPVLLNTRLSQKLIEHFEVYAMCKNIFDDYAADPFNPGPGRQFLFGAKGEL